MIQFIFDLDGTLTRVESLPFMAQHFGLRSAMAEQTMQAVHGHVPFEQNLRERVCMFSHVPIEAAAQFLATVPLYENIVSFIEQHSAQCCIATANLDVWLTHVQKRLPCEVHCSKAQMQGQYVVGIESILQKEMLVQQWQEKGHRVVFVGDGQHDVAALRCADVGIAAAMTHAIAPSVQEAAQHVAYSEEQLYAFLCAELKKNQ